MPGQRRSRPAARLSAFYAAAFLVTGVQLPFWPVWLASRGFDAKEIGTLFAAAIWAKVIATPAIGALADRYGRRRVMTVLAMIAVAAYTALWRSAGFWAILSLNLLALTVQSALMPLGDTVTLAASRAEGLDYGRIRVWGSVSFVFASLGAGVVIAHTSGGWILPLVLVASALLLTAAPDCGTSPAIRDFGFSSPAPRPCRRAIRSITVSLPFIGARSAFPRPRSAGFGRKASLPKFCCSGRAAACSGGSARSA
jgi:PPP family 3-phenylpropionic acid transporter